MEPTDQNGMSGGLLIRLLTRYSLTVLLLGLIGCSKGDGLERCQVAGTVTLNGEPLPAGIIRFLPIQGSKGPASGGSISNGKFEISEDRGPIAGIYEVVIHEGIGGKNLPGANGKAASPKAPVTERFEAVVEPEAKNQFVFTMGEKKK